LKSKLEMNRNREKWMADYASPSFIICRNIIPAVMAMLMVLVYNLADTFFIGQTHDDVLVASVSLATPVFLLFMAWGNLFGMGGTSAISRALGETKIGYAGRVCSFVFWSSLSSGIVITVLFLFCMDHILRLIGASPDTWGPTKEYLMIVTFGGPFVVLSNCYANILRAEGKTGSAMLGQIIGNLLNVILDPVMILVFGWGIAGAAIATVIGNLAAALFYVFHFLSGRSILTISPKAFSVKNHIARNVFAIGIPAAIGSMMVSFAHILVNACVVSYGDMALAGMGVAMKVTMIIGLVGLGIGQGVQPVFGFLAGAGEWAKVRAAMRISLCSALCMGILLTGICYLCAKGIVGVFLSDINAFEYALSFTRILLSTSWLLGVFFVLLNALQAIGAAKEALVINLSRQGILYVPTILWLGRLSGVYGLAWAQPVTDVIGIVLVSFFFWSFLSIKETCNKVRLY